MSESKWQSPYWNPRSTLLETYVGEVRLRVESSKENWVWFVETQDHYGDWGSYEEGTLPTQEEAKKAAVKAMREIVQDMMYQVQELEKELA